MTVANASQIGRDIVALSLSASDGPKRNFQVFFQDEEAKQCTYVEGNFSPLFFSFFPDLINWRRTAERVALLLAEIHRHASLAEG